jgi:hypothetical protein
MRVEKSTTAPVKAQGPAATVMGLTQSLKMLICMELLLRKTEANRSGGREIAGFSISDTRYPQSYPHIRWILQAAGWPIWPLLACSVLALALIIERFWSLRAERVAPKALLADIDQFEGKALPDAETADKLAGHSLLGEVLAAGLRAVQTEPLINDVRLRQVFEVAGRGAVHRLERYLTRWAPSPPPRR